MFTSVALCACLAAPASGQTETLPAPAASGSVPVAPPPNAATANVAFDEVEIVTMGPYASAPGDFAKEATALEALAASRAANPAKNITVVIPTKSLKRYAYWHGVSRVEDVLAHTIVITKPGEIDILDTEKKTYQKSSVFATIPYVPGGVLPQGAAKQPGTVDIEAGFDSSPPTQVTVDGKTAQAYVFSFSVKAYDATGSCLPFSKFLDLHATLTDDVLERPEPSAVTATNPLSIFFTPQNLATMPFFDPAGCALHTLRVSLTRIVNLLAFGEFALYRRIEIVPSASTGAPIRPTIVSERGNVRDLTDADASLFEVPADYTLIP